MNVCLDVVLTFCASQPLAEGSLEQQTKNEIKISFLAA